MKKIWFVIFFAFLITVQIAYGKDQNVIKSDISRSFLGAYKKAMRFYPEMEKYSRKYNIDPKLALVIMMYESGGNENLVSCAGAQGLMQVMLSTKKDMAVESNIEAGIKYLSYLKKKFVGFLKERDGCVSVSKLNSLVIMAYNGGPYRARKGLIKVETYQYLQGVSLYFNLLSQKIAQIEALSQNLEVVVLDEPRTWYELSEQFGVSVIELRLYNPFISYKFPGAIPKGWAIVYPKNSKGIFFETLLKDSVQQRFFYVVKHGDILHHLANAFGFSYEEMRGKSGLLLWGSLQPGVKIEVTDSPHIKK